MAGILLTQELGRCLRLALRRAQGSARSRFSCLASSTRSGAAIASCNRDRRLAPVLLLHRGDPGALRFKHLRIRLDAGPGDLAGPGFPVPFLPGQPDLAVRWRPGIRQDVAARDCGAEPVAGLRLMRRRPVGLDCRMGTASEDRPDQMLRLRPKACATQHSDRCVRQRCRDRPMAGTTRDLRSPVGIMG